MLANSFVTAARRDPTVLLASFGANLLSLAVPMAMIHIYDRVIPNQGYQTLLALGLMAFGAILAEVTLRSARRHLLEIAADRFETDAYRAAVSRLLAADPARAPRTSQGHLYRCLTGIERLRGYSVSGLATDIFDLPFALLFLTVIALISPLIGLAVFVLLAFSFLVLRRARRRVLALQLRAKENEERRHSFLAEILRGADVVKSLRIEDFILRRYERLLGGAAETSARTAGSVQLAQGFTAAVGTLTPLVIASIGAWLVIAGQLTVGALAAIVLMTGRIIQPVLRIEAVLAGSDNIRHHQAELEEVLALSPAPQAALPLGQVRTLALEGVGTAPDPVSGTAFRGLDLTLAPGDCLALEGGTLQARRAFLHLLAGEVLVSEGRLLLNGRAAADYALDDRRRRIRLLSSENALIEGSLLENLTAFRPRLYRDRAIELAERLGIERAISQSPEGLALAVGPDLRARLPKSLSDAVAIVGALVTDPDVVLFDEPNAALDREIDARLLDLLQADAGRRITVLISNRPSYLRLATRSLDLDAYLQERAA